MIWGLCVCFFFILKFKFVNLKTNIEEFAVSHDDKML